MTTLIVDIKRSSLDDGPGIRSVVFFKGCPLRCAWCQNPETFSSAAELQRLPECCTACGACEKACPDGTARPAAHGQPGACRVCGGCVEACSGGARRVAGREWSADELLALLLRDEPFYRASGGGVTLSGGEPTLHLEYVAALAERLAARGVHVLLETCGQFDGERFERTLLPHLGAIYFDVKLADAAAHRRHTGSDNARIQRNLQRLAECAAERLLPRVPLVPGITDAPQNLMAIAGRLRALRLSRVALLPYNPLWLPKRRALGLELPYAHAEWMREEDVERCAAILRGAGLEVVR